MRGVPWQARVHARRGLRFRAASRRPLSRQPERQAEDTPAVAVSPQPRVYRFRLARKLSFAILRRFAWPGFSITTNVSVAKVHGRTNGPACAMTSVRIAARGI